MITLFARFVIKNFLQRKILFYGSKNAKKKRTAPLSGRFGIGIYKNIYFMAGANPRVCRAALSGRYSE
jgi:hypothetical protein